MVLTNALNSTKHDLENKIPSPIKPGHQRRQSKLLKKGGGSRSLVIRARSSASVATTSAGPSRLPAVDVEMADTPASEPASRPMLNFPHTLPRLPYRAPCRAAITSVDKELADVPIEFIRDGITAHAVEMQRPMFGIRAMTPTTLPAAGKLPESMRIQFKPVFGILPTHLLAICPQTKKTEAQPTVAKRAILLPTHSLVIASYCTSPGALATLKAAANNSTSPKLSSDLSLNMNVAPLVLPSPESFLGLSRFLYFKDLEMLYRDILPSQPPSRTACSGVSEVQFNGRCHGFSTWMAKTFTPAVLHTYARIIIGTHQNAFSLGIHDVELIQGLDFAWTLMRNALLAAHKTVVVTPQTPPSGGESLAQRAQVALQEAAATASSS